MCSTCKSTCNKSLIYISKYFLQAREVLPKTKTFEHIYIGKLSVLVVSHYIDQMKDGGSNHYFSNKEQNSNILLRFYFLGKIVLSDSLPFKGFRNLLLEFRSNFSERNLEIFKTTKLVLCSKKHLLNS